MPVVPYTLVTLNVWGALVPHCRDIDEGKVKVTGGGVSVMVIFRINIVWSTELACGIAATIRYDWAVVKEL